MEVAVKEKTHILLSMIPVVLLGLGGGACTTLGPMPGMTVANPVPEHRPGAEAQVAIVPGFYLSDSTQEDPDRGHIEQISGFVGLGDRWPLKGLSFGGRWIGGGDETGYFEPMVRYRRYLDDDGRVSLAAVGYGTYASRSYDGASYEVARGGAEVSTDIRVTPRNDWAELHLVGGASVTAISGNGSYCMNTESGYGVDCGDGELANAYADILGAYPSAFVGIGVDLFRHPDIVFHHARLGGFVGGGTMPRIRSAELQESPESWFTWGANLTIAMGAAR